MKKPTLSKRDKIHEFLDSLTPSERAAFEERFFSKVRINEETGCHEWTAALSHGYGVFGVRRRSENQVFNLRAHRLAFALAGNTLIKWTPKGMSIDHICNNPVCVNPQHLRQVSVATNVLASPSHKHRTNKFFTAGRKYNRSQLNRTHCKYGHEFSHARFRTRDRHWTLVCATCSRQHARDAYWKKRQISQPTSKPDDVKRVY